jgi:hypothetical protein
MATAPSGRAVPPHRSRRVGRTILLIGAGALGLSALTLALLPSIVSLEPVKERIVAQVEAALHRKVDVGALRLQIFSGLGVGIEDLTVYNPPGWRQPHVLKAAMASVKVAWRPLLRRRLEITQMTLRGGHIVVERDAQGRLNIADLIPSAPAATTSPPAPSQPPSPSLQRRPEGDRVAGLSVADVILQDVTLAFMDHAVAPDRALTTTVHDMRLDLRDMDRGTPMSFELAATALADRPGNLRARGHVGPLPKALGGGLPVEARLQIADVLVSELAPYLGARLPLAQGRIAADVAAQGQVGGGLAVKGSLSLADAMLRDMAMGGPPNPLPELTATYDLALDMAAGRLQLTEALVQLAGVQATLAGTVHDLMSDPQFDLRLTTNSFAPGALLTAFPRLAAGLPPPTELRGSAQLQATLSGRPRDARAAAQIDLRQIALQSGAFKGGRPEGGGIQLETDDAHALLTLRVEPPQPPHVHMDVRAQRLAFDRQAAQGAHTASSPGPDSHPAGDAPPAKPAPPFTLDGQVSVAEGRMAGVNFRQLTADVALRDGALTSTQQVEVYAGSYRGDLRVDLAPSEPPYTLHAKLLDLDVGQALNALSPLHNPVFGVLSADMRLSGQGLTWELMRRTLTGDGAFRISEAKLTAFDLLPKLAQLLRGVAGIAVPTAWERATFTTVEGPLHLRQGKVFTDALKLRGQGLEASLKGAVGLDQGLDYAGTVFVPGQLVGERGPLTLLPRDDRGRLAVPFAVKGTVQAPQIVFDEKSLRRVAGEALIDTIHKQLGGAAAGSPPSAAEGPEQRPGQPGDEARPPPKRDLPRKILEELLRR